MRIRASDSGIAGLTFAFDGELAGWQAGCSGRRKEARSVDLPVARVLASGVCVKRAVLSRWARAEGHGCPRDFCRNNYAGVTRVRRHSLVRSTLSTRTAFKQSSQVLMLLSSAHQPSALVAHACASRIVASAMSSCARAFMRENTSRQGPLGRGLFG